MPPPSHGFNPRLATQSQKDGFDSAWPFVTVLLFMSQTVAKAHDSLRQFTTGTSQTPSGTARWMINENMLTAGIKLASGADGLNSSIGVCKIQQEHA